MRLRAHYLGFIYFLATGLLFNQVALNYFHDTHDAHEYKQLTSQAHLQKHGQHCKICALDTLYNLYFEKPADYQSHPVHLSAPNREVPDIVQHPVCFIKERAPPVA